MPVKRLIGILCATLCCVHVAAETSGNTAVLSDTQILNNTPVSSETQVLDDVPALDEMTSVDSIPLPELNAPRSAAMVPKARIVLILDDLGNNLALGQRAIELPGNINYSILPQSPNGPVLARQAHQRGKEVMLHVPMSNIHGKRMGPGALTPAMEKEQFITTLREDLLSVPHVQGVNNHMGSLLTQLHQPMSWFMQELKQQQLYFVDSRTSPLTVAESLAENYKLPHLRRHIFLDNLRTQEAISEQFERLINLAKRKGSAVAIGHPHPETLEFLERTLPDLHQRKAKLVFASEMFNNKANACNIETASDEGCSRLSHLIE